MKCLACGEEMVPRIGDEVTHASCLMVEPVDEGQDAFSMLLRHQLLEIILWQANQNPRNSQPNIGPSEMGNPCERAIGYRLAGVPEINVDTDPWASTVGTAIHSWLERAVHDWMQVNGKHGRYLTEVELALGELVTGHMDLYDTEQETVIDWKTVGVDMLREVEANRIPDGYKIQAHIYGYLFSQRGAKVKRVALVFLPRANLLSRTVTWSALYDETVATTALTRVYGIARKVLALGISNESHGHRWEQVEATPEKCALCPWYEHGRDPERGADGTGCPGR